MILQKIFLKLKSPEVADSRFMHNYCTEHVVRLFLKIYNRTASDLPICKRVKKGALGERSRIHPSAIIDYDHVIIGNSCTIEKNVVIEKNTVIGSRVTISEGAVIGSEGFEQRRVAGEIVPIVHCGGVIIGDNVFIGRRACVDRSVLDDYTEIGDSSVIQANVQIGHGIKIGRQVTISEGTMIGGYTTVMDCAFIGRHCSVADGIFLHNGVVIPDNSVVTRDMKYADGATRPANDQEPCPGNVPER